MPRAKQTRGACVYCGRELTRTPMAKHLASCAKRREAIAAADAQGDATETLYHLQIQDAYISDFWLQVEMRGPAKLASLDSYLRAIWLECCGHMSRFSLNGWQSDDIAMSKRAESVFSPGLTLVHQYDFGTTSETLIKVVATRAGRPTTKHPIALMARNHMPEVPCTVCNEPAQWLCFECLYEGESGWLCNTHAKEHADAHVDGPVAIVNSPRLGMCGYDGPAEPPY